MGVFVQIEIILGQPIDDRIISILFIYRINRNLLELPFQQEDLFQTFQPRLHQNNNVNISLLSNKVDNEIKPYGQ
ncbi:unnamed protein product [Rotaria sordida]|uniref:Uncharacterized protein n=1 Tax=Rotaria sordida TaxID=392033 RepID=A0A814WBC8_9BILA|nr:unnamed protein product [Rotaria sordida]CAF1199101.1 unnamed protein product [Rotaria sordida]